MTVVLLAVVAKGLAFLREPLIAAVLGTTTASDAYYLAIGIPFVLYNLLGLPFALWVTARLAAVRGGGAGVPHAFYRRALGWGTLGASALALGVVAVSREVVLLYAPGLADERLAEAVSVARVSAAALPALVVQGVCGGRLFAQRRFVTVYLWLALGGVVGLLGVAVLTPSHGAFGAVLSFVLAWWTTGIGLLAVQAARGLRTGVTEGPVWTEDLGTGVVYRAVAMQVFLQGGALLVYTFSSRLGPGEIAAVLFASKIVMAIYETVVLTAGVLVFPGIARHLQQRDEGAVARVVVRALTWLIPGTVAFGLLLALSRTELVALIYQRRAFGARAVALVSRALLGYAPYVVGITLVEILHRAMVLRGRMGGYFVIFTVALALNWLACLVLVPRLGVLGVTWGASIGVIAAGVGLWFYALRRLTNLEAQPVALVLGRTVAAAGAAFAVVMPLRAQIATPGSPGAQLVLLVAGALAAGIVFLVLMFALGYRWPWADESDDRKAAA